MVRAGFTGAGAWVVRRIGRGLGAALAVAAAAALVAQLLSLLANGGAYVPLSLRSLWAAVDPAGADGVAPDDPAGWALAVPAWLAFAAPAAVLLLACRGGQRRGAFD